MHKFILAAALFALASLAHGQATCTVTGPAGYNGIPTPALNVTCGSGPPPPPPPPPPVVACDASQLSSSVAGHFLRRQCSVTMYVMPSGDSYNGPATDLGTVLGGTTWPNYNYAGYSPTYTISSGYYISLAFTPTSAGAFQLTANGSYGDGGTISVSTQPGALTANGAGFVCGMARNIVNGIYVTTTAGSYCAVTPGTTYFLNLADTDASGNNLCYNGRPGTCASSTVSYTIYTSGP